MLKRNLVFSCACFLTMLSFIITAIVFLFPGIKEPTVSELELRKLTSLEEVLSKSVLAGDAQVSVESYISDHLPLRETACLFNAAYQREAIKLASLPLGYSAIPTFYGSEVDSLNNGERLIGTYKTETLRKYHKAFF